MERSNSKTKAAAFSPLEHFTLFMIGFAVGIFFLIRTANAEVILVQPPERPTEPVAREEFPESRFGQAPTHPLKPVSREPASLVREDGTQMGSASQESRTAKAHYPTDSAREADKEMREKGTTKEEVYEYSHSSRNTQTLDLIPDRAKGVQEISIIAGDLGFFPKTIFVTRDVPVRLFVTGASKNTLCFMMDAHDVKKQVRSQKIEEISFTPGSPGQFRFYCPVNGMEGVMVVKELATTVAGQ